MLTLSLQLRSCHQRHRHRILLYLEERECAGRVRRVVFEGRSERVAEVGQGGHQLLSGPIQPRYAGIRHALHAMRMAFPRSTQTPPTVADAALLDVGLLAQRA